MDKLPLQNILRQLLCGAVFFFSLCVILPAQAVQVLIILDFADAIPGAITVLLPVSLAVGTLIYHLEKNLYSYSAQILFMRTFSDTQTPDDETGNCQLSVGCIGLIVGIVTLILLLLFVLFSYNCKSCHQNMTKALFTLIGMIFIVLIMITLTNPTSVCKVAKATRRLWCAESGVKSGKNDEISTNTKECFSTEEQVIMYRVGNWADFIHCGQCCAFAWILGSFCAFTYCSFTSVPCPYFVINIGLLASLSVLGFELFADWHRYHHVLYVLNNNAKGESEFDPTSNSQQ